MNDAAKVLVVSADGAAGSKVVEMRRRGGGNGRDRAVVWGLSG